MSDYRIIRATIEDGPRITSFLREAYYNTEPLNVAKGLAEKPSEAEIIHTLKSLSEEKSLLAVTSDNTIIGVIINGEVTENETKEIEDLIEKCECKDFEIFLKFSLHVIRNANFWKCTDEKKALDTQILAVDFGNRGRSVGNSLATVTKELARNAGYKIYRAACTSYYAANLSELQGMTCVFEINFDDYKDENGEIVFNVPAPHKALRLFMQQL